MLASSLSDPLTWAFWRGIQAATPNPGFHMSELRRTPFYDNHVAAGARMVPFAGFEMPVQDLDELAEFCLEGIRNEDFVIMIGRETMEATLVDRAKKLAAGECPIELEHMGLS